MNNGNNTFSVFRTSTTEAPKTAGFTLSDVILEAGTYIFGGLDDGRWTTTSDEYLLLRFLNSSTNATIADITTEPKIVTFAEATTVKSTMYFGKKYSGVYKTIAPEIRKCTAATVKQDWTVSQNRALLTQTDIYDAIKKIAKLYGVKVIDVSGESMMNTAFS